MAKIDQSINADNNKKLSEGKKVYNRITGRPLKGEWADPRAKVYKGKVVKPLNPRKESQVKPELDKNQK